MWAALVSHCGEWQIINKVKKHKKLKLNKTCLSLKWHKSIWLWSDDIIGLAPRWPRTVCQRPIQMRASGERPKERLVQKYTWVLQVFLWWSSPRSPPGHGTGSCRMDSFFQFWSNWEAKFVHSPDCSFPEWSKKEHFWTGLSYGHIDISCNRLPSGMLQSLGSVLNLCRNIVNWYSLVVCGRKHSVSCTCHELSRWF